MSDDAPLIDVIRAGDWAAFGGLVHRYQGRLFTTLLYAVGYREEACADDYADCCRGTSPTESSGG